MQDYIIKIKDGSIAVSDDIYNAYYKQKWHEDYEYRKRLRREISFEGLCESGVIIESIMVETPKTLEDEVITGIMIVKLHESLLKLTEDELSLIMEIFYKDRTIRQVANSLSASKSTIQRQKDRILRKLYFYIEEYE